MTKTIQINQNGELVFSFPEDRTLKRAMQGVEGSSFLHWEECWIAPPTENNLRRANKFGTRYGFEVNLTRQVEPGGAHSLLEHYQQMRLEASRATHAPEDIPIPGLGGRLYPFQEAAVWYAARTQRCFLADESGLGKSVQALATLQYVDAFPALIVCPLSLKWHWYAEIRRWLPSHTVSIIEAGKKVEKTDLIVTHYELLDKKWRLKALRAKAIILDEGHLLRNSSPNVPFDLIADIPYRLMLTGTPVIHRPADLITPLRFLNLLDDLGGYEYFVARYCAGGGFRDILGLEGAHHLPELNEKLRIYGYIRRTKAQVLPEFPEKKRTLVHLVVKPGEFYQKAVEDYQVWVSQNPALADQPGMPRDLQSLKSAAFYGKWSSVLTWIAQFLKAGEKVVVFANHLEAIEELVDTYQALAITHKTSLKDRQDFVNQFQNNPGIQMLALTLNLGGLGWALHAACHVVFVELSWSPAELDQAEARLHMLGQKRTVYAWYLIAQGTIEEQLYQWLEYKRQDLEAVTEGRTVMESPRFRVSTKGV